MADLSPSRLSGIEAVLLHGLTFVSASVLHDDRLDRVVTELRQALTKVPTRAGSEKLRLAAQSICETFPRRNQRSGAADWALANMKADSAVRDYHWAAFCAVAGA